MSFSSSTSPPRFFSQGLLRRLPPHREDPSLEERWFSAWDGWLSRFPSSVGFVASLHYAISPTLWRLEGYPSLKEVPLLQEVIVWILGQIEVPLEIQEDFSLVSEEAISNVLRHSYLPSQDPWLAVEIQAISSPKGFRLTFFDRGKAGFSTEIAQKYDAIPPQGRPPLRHRGGLGMFLLKRLSTSLRYLPGSDSEETRLLLEKSLEHRS